MTRQENHSHADPGSLEPSLKSSSRLLKYGLTRICHQSNCPARPDSQKGTRQTGTGMI